MDPFIFTKRSPFLQRVADYVRTGHTRYVSGDVPLQRARRLYEKFDRFYDISLNNLQASRRRKAGYAVGRLLMIHEGGDNLKWILLISNGDLIDDRLERWRDALKDRIQFWGYELVRLTKPRHPRPVWTWRYAREQEEEIRDALRLAIRQKRDDELKRLIYTIWRTPGFSGARSQVKKMGQLIKSEWKRSRREGEAMPEIPARIGYVQRLMDKGAPLSKLIRRTAGPCDSDNRLSAT